jgi:hypothetical protein
MKKSREISSVIKRPSGPFQTLVALTHLAAALGAQRSAPESKVKRRRNQMETLCAQARRK